MKQTRGFEYAYNNSLGPPVITMKYDTGDTKEQGSAELLGTVSNMNTAENIFIQIQLFEEIKKQQEKNCHITKRN